MARPKGSFDPRKQTSITLTSGGRKGLLILAKRRGAVDRDGVVNLSKFLDALGKEVLTQPLQVGDPVIGCKVVAQIESIDADWVKVSWTTLLLSSTHFQNSARLRPEDLSPRGITGIGSFEVFAPWGTITEISTDVASIDCGDYRWIAPINQLSYDERRLAKEPGAWIGPPTC